MKRFICICYDKTQTNDYADFTLTKEMAATILTARKRLGELKKQFELVDLEFLTFAAGDRVRYFCSSRLGEPGVRDHSGDPEAELDLLTEEQRAALDNYEHTEVSLDFKLHTSSPDQSGYDFTDVDRLVVSEDFWWFESHADDYALETEGFSFDLLQQVL